MKNNYCTTLQYDDTISHFTNCCAFFSILKSKRFIPRYNLQELPYVLDRQEKQAFPMICFCASGIKIDEHIKRYGDYGIELSKKWALTNNLKPIMYFHEHTQIGSYISNIVNLFSKNYNKTISLPDWRNLFYTLLNMKYYETSDSDIKNGKDRQIFYNEREWRYIPNENGEVGLISESEFVDNNMRKQNNDKISGYKLTFKLNDIKYLFISKKVNKDCFDKMFEKNLKDEISEKIISKLRDKIRQI